MLIEVWGRDTAAPGRPSRPVGVDGLHQQLEIRLKPLKRLPRQESGRGRL